MSRFYFPWSKPWEQQQAEKQKEILEKVIKEGAVSVPGVNDPLGKYINAVAQALKDKVGKMPGITGIKSPSRYFEDIAEVIADE